MAHLEQKLKTLIPAAQQGNEALDQYLTAVGKLLDSFEGAIDNFKYYSDYQKVPETLLEDFGGQLDITFPRNLATSKKREIIKDAIEFYRSNGTEKALKRVFKLLGWRVTIEYCWTLNEEVATQVQYKYNGTIQYLDDSPYTYNNNSISSPVGLYSLIFGKEKIYSNGTYADLYDASGNTYNKNTIKGEYYKEDVQENLLVVIKAPYIKINVNEEDYQLFTQDYVDPVTGEVFSYSDTEEYEITQELIKYFIEQARPANVAILEIATPFSITDTIEETPTDNSITLTASNVSALYDGTLTYGVDMDRYALGETYGGFQYGTSAMTYYPTPSQQTVTRSYAIGSSGLQQYIPTRKNVDVTLTVPADCTVVIQKTKTDRKNLALDQGLWTSSIAYTNVTNLVIPISDCFAIAINIVTPSSTGTVEVSVLQK